MEKMCIISFLKNGHSFHLYTYGDVKGIPKGTMIKDANKIIPSNMIFKYKDHDSYAGFSNLFRYKLLLEKGNYWVDTDITCLQPLDSSEDYIFATERLSSPLDENKIQANCCLMKVPAGSDIMKYCLEEAIIKDNHTLKWGDTGPRLLSNAITKLNMESHLATPKEYCPINWWEWSQVIDDTIDKKMISNSKTIHLWNEMWRRNKADKSRKYDNNSIFEWLKKRYLT